MRLIHTETLELREFADGSVPPYAILSHVWGDEADECRFQDFANVESHSDEVKSKKGYAKIVNFCRVAREDGHEWAWADTVCIDKSTYDELNTAINSMFGWYEKSQACYAYLEDTEAPAEWRESTFTEYIEDWEEDPLTETFEKSSWFTRGWTLQELLAPSILYFYTREWKLLCTKANARNQISLVTLIPTAVIHPFEGPILMGPLQQWSAYSAWRKMQWAWRRRTGAVEDMAYSLLGLFGVQMPIAYGEGDHAFARLQSLIITQTGDPSLLVWQNDQWLRPGGVRPCPYLALSPSDFIDRDFAEVAEDWDIWTHVKGEIKERPRIFESDKGIILSGVLIETIDDRLVLTTLGNFNSSHWVSFANEEYLIPLYTDNNAEYQRMTLPIFKADLTRVALMYNGLPMMELPLKNPYSHPSDSSDATGGVIPSVDLGVLVTFPLGRKGYSPFARFPNIESPYPGVLVLHPSGKFHYGVVVLQNQQFSPLRLIGFLFVKDNSEYYHPPRKACRILLEVEDVTEEGLQRVSERQANDLWQSNTWKKTHQRGETFLEFEEQKSSGPGLESEFEPEFDSWSQILVAQIVFNSPK